MEEPAAEEPMEEPAAEEPMEEPAAEEPKEEPMEEPMAFEGKMVEAAQTATMAARSSRSRL